MTEDEVQAQREKVQIIKPSHIFGQQAEDHFLDNMSLMAIERGVDVEIRNGKGVEIVSLEVARRRLSSRELEMRIHHQEFVIEEANREIKRLEEISVELHGESQLDKNTSKSS
jgi:hypothetical protein